MAVHGTGTPLGDPIEVGALDAAFGNKAARSTGDVRSAPLLLGANKVGTSSSSLPFASRVACTVRAHCLTPSCCDWLTRRCGAPLRLLQIHCADTQCGSNMTAEMITESVPMTVFLVPWTHFRFHKLLELLAGLLWAHGGHGRRDRAAAGSARCGAGTCAAHHQPAERKPLCCRCLWGNRRPPAAAGAASSISSGESLFLYSTEISLGLFCRPCWYRRIVDHDAIRDTSAVSNCHLSGSGQRVCCAPCTMTVRHSPTLDGLWRWQWHSLTQAADWGLQAPPGTVAAAGTTAFGMSGVNAHLLMEAAPGAPEYRRPPQLGGMSFQVLRCPSVA